MEAGTPGQLYGSWPRDTIGDFVTGREYTTYWWPLLNLDEWPFTAEISFGVCTGSGYNQHTGLVSAQQDNAIQMGASIDFSGAYEFYQKLVHYVAYPSSECGMAGGPVRVTTMQQEGEDLDEWGGGPFTAYWVEAFEDPYWSLFDCQVTGPYTVSWMDLPFEYYGVPNGLLQDAIDQCIYPPGPVEEEPPIDDEWPPGDGWGDIDLSELPFALEDTQRDNRDLLADILDELRSRESEDEEPDEPVPPEEGSPGGDFSSDVSVGTDVGGQWFDDMLSNVSTRYQNLIELAKTRIPFGLGGWIPVLSVGGTGACVDPEITLLGTTSPLGWCDTPMYTFLTTVGRGASLLAVLVGFYLAAARTLAWS